MTKIAILGCGISGMITALSLASKGIKTTILERSDLKFPKDPRTTALTGGSKRFLEAIALWPKLEAHISQIKNIYVVDNKSPEMMHLEPSSDAMGYMIANADLKPILFKATKSHPLITLHTEVDYKIQDLRDYNLVLVCDGKNSKIRQEYFEDKVSKSYGQSAMTFIVRHERPHEGTAVEHFMTQGVFAILPLRDQYRSSIVWCEKEEVTKLYMKMKRDEFVGYLQERFGEFLGKVEIESNPVAFPLSARITKRYYSLFPSDELKTMIRGSYEISEALGSMPYGKKSFLAVLGDSAHTIHPLAGQGLNQGIKDIEVLTNIISRNLSVGLDIDEIALEEYENKRKRDNYAMYLITDNLNRLFSNNLPILSDIRKCGLYLAQRIPRLKRMIADHRGWGDGFSE